ncbi:hypothetical protein [Paenibacillus sp. YYML68]|uniref:hypothetical protein n=1 Tax=Paenibacillus sp. YYML68 TaxID=2909250 RepID=UPI0024928B97|nr:hypothetical protein [Paenibacillus sp. YYML68]
MQYSLLDNGVDSLKAAYNCIIKIPELREGLEHNIKDAVLSLNHAVERFYLN